jgi:hypothetical protein
MFTQWLKAVGSHWKREVLGGALIGVLALYSDLSGNTVPPRVYELSVVALIFYAMFLAWRDEFRRSLDMVAAASARPTGPKATVIMKHGNCPCLLVTNEGTTAEFYGKLSISHEIMNEPTELFCRWDHTDLPRAKIAHGETCRIVLANLVMDAPSRLANWTVRGTSEKGPIDVTAHYSSSLDSPAQTRAPDVILTGTLFAQPDLIDGPLPFRVVLQAFGSSSNKTGEQPNA